VVGIDRSAPALQPHLQLHGGIAGAAGAGELVQRPQVQRVELARVLQRLIQPPVLGITASGGGAGEADEREGLRRSQRVVLADAVGERSEERRVGKECGCRWSAVYLD